MASSTTITARTWRDVFERLDQWEDSAQFDAACNQELKSITGFRRLCSPKIGHLIRLQSGAVQIIYNISQAHEDTIVGSNDELRALTGASSTASTVVIDDSGAYDTQTGMHIEWSTMVNWEKETDIDSEARDAMRSSSVIVRLEPKDKAKASKTVAE